MGHEAAGTVAEIGSRVVGLSRGDRVTFDSTLYCGECDFCRRGDVNLCDRRQVIGVACQDFTRAGAFAEYVVVPARIVYRLPDNLSFTEAAMLEAVAVALHAVSLAPPAAQSAVVIGAGMIGLLIVQALRVAGCSRVLVTDVDESRLKLAEKLGADATLRAAQPGVREGIQRLSRGVGVDLAIEAVGRNEIVQLAINSVRKGGPVVLVGNVTPQVELPLQTVVTRQLR